MKKYLLSILCISTALFAKAQVSSCTYSGMLIGSGTAGPVGDDNTTSVSLPFTFDFYGTSYTNAIISTNGFIWLGTTGGAGCCSGYLIPSDVGLSSSGGYIALTQTDWLPTSPVNGTIFYDVTGTSPNRVFVVHYEDVKHISSSDRMTGEIQLYETSNEVRLVMSSLTGFASYTGTMGIAAGDGINGVAVGTRNQSASYTASNECWSLSSSTVLPITLLQFDAGKSGQSAVINWKTGIEENNSHFVIERSTNGKDYKRVATVNSKGNTPFGHQYTVTDASPLSGKNMYRLVQYDLDNKATYYGTRMVDFENLKQISFEPNPFADQLNISIPGGSGKNIQVTIMDVYGKKVSELQQASSENDQTLTISSREWATGFYSVKIERDGILENYKVIKQ